MREISQACAVNTGCFAGDTAGFPVTIAVSGSYRLTTDLVNTNANVHGIRVAADYVTIDLNGFRVAGPVTCSGVGPTLTCSRGGTGNDTGAGSPMARRHVG